MATLFDGFTVMRSQGAIRTRDAVRVSESHGNRKRYFLPMDDIIYSLFLKKSGFFYYKSSFCIPEGVLRRARYHMFVCLHKPLSAPGFMGLRPIPPPRYLGSCYDSPAASGGHLFCVSSTMGALFAFRRDLPRKEWTSSTPGFMRDRSFAPCPVLWSFAAIPPLVYLCSCCDSPAASGGYLFSGHADHVPNELYMEAESKTYGSYSIPLILRN